MEASLITPSAENSSSKKRLISLLKSVTFFIVLLFSLTFAYVVYRSYPYYSYAFWVVNADNKGRMTMYSYLMQIPEMLELNHENKWYDLTKDGIVETFTATEYPYCRGFIIMHYCYGELAYSKHRVIAF